MHARALRTSMEIHNVLLRDFHIIVDTKSLNKWKPEEMHNMSRKMQQNLLSWMVDVTNNCTRGQSKITLCDYYNPYIINLGLAFVNTVGK
jgi:hypothetical protein